MQCFVVEPQAQTIAAEASGLVAAADARAAAAEQRAAASKAERDEEAARCKELQSTLGLQAHQVGNGLCPWLILAFYRPCCC